MLIAAPGVAALAAEPVIEGDRALLDALRAARETNMAAVVRGQAALRFEWFASREGGRGRFTWDHDKSYFEGITYQDSFLRLPNGKVEVSRREPDFQMIKTPEETIRIWGLDRTGRGQREVQRAPSERLSTYRTFDLRPDQCWFAFECSGDIGYAHYLDPAADNGAVRYRVERDPLDQVRVDLFYADGTRFQIRASLRHGGNVVSHESFPVARSEHSKRKASFTWVQHQSGAWYPRKMHWQHWQGRTTEEGAPNEFLMEIDEFDPNPVIPANRFSFDSLKIPAGETIHDFRGPMPVYSRHGALEPESVIPSLERLAQYARSTGFASPARRKPSH